MCGNRSTKHIEKRMRTILEVASDGDFLFISVNSAEESEKTTKNEEEIREKGKKIERKIRGKWEKSTENCLR